MKLMNSKFAGTCKCSGIKFDAGAEVLWLGSRQGCVLLSWAKESCTMLVFENMLEMMLQDREPVEEFTVERAQGETYANPDEWVLYAHATYGRSSVLEGRSKRIYVESIGDAEEARSFMNLVPKWMPCLHYCGSTHVPVEQVVAHLPDQDWC
mgnify:CR=1 FL=1|jgi:hypothetical protein